MEKTKMSYQNGKIYAIRSYQTDNVYYGSTTQSLSKRLSKHKSDYKLWKNGKCNYISSYEIVKFDDCYVELYEDYPCNSKAEIERREGEIIRAENNAINKIIAGRTPKEYYADNADIIKQRHKQYYVDNAEKIKQYYVDNAEKIKQQTKRYREINANTVKLYKSIKHECQCGGKYTNSCKSTHVKTKKHTNYLESIQA